MIIRGEKVYLRPIEDADFPQLVAWTNDPEIRRLMDGDYPTDLEACAKWHEAGQGSRHSQRYAVCETGDGALIGDMALDHIAWRSGNAELRIRIGEKEYWERGYGTDAVTALLDHAFRRMNLSLVYLRVFSFNKRAVSCYEKCGFRKEGRLRRPGPDGVPVLVLLMRITKDEFVRHGYGHGASEGMRTA